MNNFLKNLLTAVITRTGDESSHALLQLAMLLEKSSRPSDEEGFYESILPPEAIALELDEHEQEEILSAIARRQHPPDLAASFPWALGKSSPKAGLPVLLDFFSDHSDIMSDPDVRYQAMIALDNCIGHVETEHLDKRATGALREFLKGACDSSDERLAEHSSRLLKRLKPRRPRRTS